MKVLVVGGGGREHALTWAIARSARRPRVFVAPGNPGVEPIATRVPIAAGDAAALLEFVRRESIDLTVVGPEQPLVAGLADRFADAGLAVFGPAREAARLEGSKAFAKEIMAAAGVPTARHETFESLEPALARAREASLPVVVKADGLAAGKGVVIARERTELMDAVGGMLSGRAFGEAGRRVVLEEFLEGREASVLVITDGERLVVLPAARDHKRVGDGDTGPNTGGMGAYAPVPDVSDALVADVREHVFGPVLAELRARDITYRGCLYAGLMLTSGGPKVLEFNCRFGDPETQAVLPLLDADLLDLLDGSARGDLGGWPPVLPARGASVCVVLASKGYPGDHETGLPIAGLDDAALEESVILFHAGTKREGGRIETAGGRVLNVTGTGATHAEARARAYAAASRIRFDGVQYRRDIAAGVE